MSQQPPYGPQEPQQPYQQPYPPYSQGAYPNPYAQFPQKPNHTTRNVLLIVGAVVLVFCGGLFALGVAFFNNVDDVFDTDYPGSENDPVSVEEGDAFSIRGFDYDQGWSISKPAQGFDTEVSGLRVTNHRDDEDAESVYLYFEFYADNARLGSISCTGGNTIAYERSARLTCNGYGEDISGYDEIEVYDSSYSE
ncbi:hypothetical protein [Nocardioides sp.]|uniref:hypothetical protein n=1 Tax=Nocardioides sp. TaxID=35761 RepID=UPI0027224201|nr:hypothetical protein [Nocardioides sp.]MDO9456613.1 hypothetical protein [Nocardioides sp.]